MKEEEDKKYDRRRKKVYVKENKGKTKENQPQNILKRRYEKKMKKKIQERET